MSLILVQPQLHVVAIGLLFKFQGTDRCFVSSDLLRRESSHCIARVDYGLQPVLLIGNCAFLVELAIEACIRPREVVHISQRLLKLGLVYLCQSAQLVLREAQCVGSVKKCHSLVLIRLGHLFVEELVSNRLILRE